MTRPEINVISNTGRSVPFMASVGTEVDASDTTTYGASVLYVGTGGDVKVTLADGGSVVFKNVPDGTFLPIYITKIWATGTVTADDFIILT